MYPPGMGVEFGRLLQRSLTMRREALSRGAPTPMAIRAECHGFPLPVPGDEQPLASARVALDVEVPFVP